MKKILIFLLLISTTCGAQFTLHGRTARISTIPPDTSYTNTLRYSLAAHAYKMNLNGYTVGQSVSTIYDLKGSVNLIYVGLDTPLLTRAKPIYTKEGWIFMQNETNIKYSGNISGSGATFPYELWTVLYKPDYFKNEKIIDGPPYVGDNGCSSCGVRFTNFIPQTGWLYENAVIPTFQMFVMRIVLYNPYVDGGGGNFSNADLYINGVQQTSVNAPISTFRNPSLWDIAIGTGQNNDYIGWAEYLQMPSLTPTQATNVYNELATAYNTGTEIQLPRANSLTYGSSGGFVTVSYTYYNPLGFPEDVSGRIIRWVQDGNLGVSNATYVSQLPTTQNGRAEVTVKDTHGNYITLPSSKYYTHP